MNISSETQKSPFSSPIFLRYGTKLLERCTVVWQALAALPRRARRRVQAVAGTSLAAVALAITLHLSPVGAAPTAIMINPGSQGIAIDGGCSLTEAILTANDGSLHGDCSGGNATALDTITLNGGTYTYTTAYAGSINALPQITDQLIIEGNGATLERGATADLFRLLETRNTDLTLNDTAVTGGDLGTANAGGGIYAYQSNLAINNGVLTNNQASRGGALEVRYGSLTVTDSTLSGNATTGTSFNGGGGALYSYRSTAVIENSQILDNTAVSGGGLSGYYASFTVRDSVISGNVASTAQGGGIRAYKSGVVVEDSEIVQNTAQLQGGGVYFNGNYGAYSVSMLRSHLTDNSANNRGGGLYGRYGSITIDDSIVSGNQSANNGGGIAFYAGFSSAYQLTVRQSQVSGNTAGTLISNGSGGGIYTQYGKVHIADSDISNNNVSRTGGGLFLYKSYDTAITRSTISHNYALLSAGGVNIYSYNYGPTAIDNTTISHNSSGQNGGGIVTSYSGTVHITRSAIHDNYATLDGGGVWAGYKTALTISHSTISGNAAGRNGGGLTNHLSDYTDFEAEDHLLNVTVTDNVAGQKGGGLFMDQSAKIVMQRSIVSGNSAVSENEIYTRTGAHPAILTADSYNILGDDSQDNTAAFGFASPAWLGASDTALTSDGGAPSSLASLLDPTLADNGGFTRSHQLVAGSPAINHVTSGGTGQVDQRYGGRIGNEDAGSVEYGAVAPEAMINGSACALADAITAANTDTATGSCTAGTAGADTIKLLDDVTLSGALPAITSTITIEGNGRTIDANEQAIKLLQVSTANGNLTVHDAMLTGSGAVGTSPLDVDAGSTMTLESTTVHDNYHLSYSGVLLNDGDVTLRNSTISKNTGLFVAGIRNHGNMTITHSTIAQNPTLWDVVGGIAQYGGTLTIENSIISEVGGSEGAVLVQQGGTIVSRGNNILGNSTHTNQSAFGYGSLAWITPNDITATSDGTTPTAIEEIIETNLADNGGGILTHQLTSNSIARDGATESCPLLRDQRGFIRLPSINVCDIGAVEANFPARQVLLASGSATITYHVGSGNALYQGTSPYGVFKEIDGSGSYVHSGATSGVSYWQVRDVTGQVLTHFAIYPYPVSAGQ